MSAELWQALLFTPPKPHLLSDVRGGSKSTNHIHKPYYIYKSCEEQQKNKLSF